MYIVWRGLFYDEGSPIAVVKHKGETVKLLKKNGWKQDSGINKDLFRKDIDGRSYWIRFDRVMTQIANIYLGG